MPRKPQQPVMPDKLERWPIERLVPYPSLAAISCSTLTIPKCAIAWWFGQTGTRLLISSDPSFDRGCRWWTSTIASKPQRTHLGPYKRLASVRQWLASFGRPLIFFRRPSLPHSGEQYWSDLDPSLPGVTETGVPHVAQATVSRSVYDWLSGPIRWRLSSSRQALEQYTRLRIAAAVPLNVFPQNWHARSTRGLNLTRLLWPDTNLLPPTSVPQPHSQNAIPCGQIGRDYLRSHFTA
jgi:hypothetical protein